ncbi:MAG: hypothetical protein MJZ11_13040 [Lachnospiraceae bacterium]|nr:hypothetical protein [Lachnospiraceae bacterium]
MKQLKKFVVLGVLLLIGINCVAQGEYQKDSIWGLEWNLEGSKLEISLLSTYTSSGEGDYFILEITTYTEGEYSDRYRYDYVNYCSTDARIVNTHRSMIMNSIKIDTLSVGLYRITAYLSLIEDYLKVPEDMSNYHGYFGISMLSDNKEVEDDYYNNCFNLTQCRQFLYFDLIGKFSSLEDINLRDGLYSESYYSMTGIPIASIKPHNPTVVVIKDADNKIVERSIRIIR